MNSESNNNKQKKCLKWEYNITLKSLLFLGIFLLFISGTGNIEFNLSASEIGVRPAKDYALFFAVQDYQKMRNLQNPIANARAIAADLEEHYGFTTEVVENPTFDDIERKLNEYKENFAKNPGGLYQSDGQLLIYFTGHGLEENNVGYFCPIDADPTRIYRTAVSYEYWRNFIDGIDCKHILVAIDACYSGWFDPSWRNKPGSTLGKRPGELSESEKLLTTHDLYTTRWFMTSATNVESPDDSNFAYHFREGLKTWGGTDGILTSSELWTKLELSSPKPHQGRFGKNDPESSFLFVLKNRKVDYDQEHWLSIQANFSKEVILEHMEKFPDCSHEKVISTLGIGFLKIPPLVEPNSSNVKKENESYPPGFEYLASDMVFISGGEFDMGDQFNEGTDDEKPLIRIHYIGDPINKDRYYKKPVHRVKVNSFYLSRYEVTQRQWKDVMGKNPSYFKGCDNCPVEKVSWKDVQKYLKKLNAKTGGNFRLPTEAEWEYAAREKGRKVRFGNGKDLADPKEMNFNGSESYKGSYSMTGDYRGKTVPVTSFSPNSLGLYNMSGNVSEWCSDWYNENYYKQFKGKTAENPEGPVSGSVRVCRGGSWHFSPLFCRVADRFWLKPDSRHSELGFRIAHE